MWRLSNNRIANQRHASPRRQIEPGLFDGGGRAAEDTVLQRDVLLGSATYGTKLLFRRRICLDVLPAHRREHGVCLWISVLLCSLREEGNTAWYKKYMDLLSRLCCPRGEAEPRRRLRAACQTPRGQVRFKFECSVHFVGNDMVGFNILRRDIVRGW